ncbi:endonuclease/exonuclease/phosphatase family protein [Streptomyces sp. NPDC088190]|uniref:endonuclease/exonuclease/phosphatase family protein n=1 Tax=unclassified Streptomyces TaxID=2593676 RepID=UPI002E77ACFD|nr:endonuclease/exonuclease/phosphatase family protein [Streptomyces sp. JV190]MEE1838385.1 endonuclease/exonuclease/phosphatase family protein [Streptomyces sp. JV190]
MEPALLKVGTWNIGGGILGESHQRGVCPSLETYVSVLEEYRPDVLCLQEAHDYQGRRAGQVEWLARRLGYSYFASFPTSASHMVENASLALGIVSRFPIRDAVYKQFPNPRLQVAGPNGDNWKLHNKGYVVGRIDLGSGTLGLVNGHCFPLHHFGISPMAPIFTRVWGMLAADLLTVGAAGPALAAVDLNYARIRDVLVEVLRPGCYFNAFDGTPTTPQGVQKDYILYGHSIRLITTTVAATGSDHSYCQATFLI